MPLSEEDWKESSPAVPWVDTIYTFLDNGYPKAYSSEEIAAEIVGEYDDQVVDTILVLFVVAQLETLLNQDKIDAKNDTEKGDNEMGTTYYRKADE